MKLIFKTKIIKSTFKNKFSIIISKSIFKNKFSIIISKSNNFSTIISKSTANHISKAIEAGLKETLVPVNFKKDWINCQIGENQHFLGKHSVSNTQLDHISQQNSSFLLSHNTARELVTKSKDGTVFRLAEPPKESHLQGSILYLNKLKMITTSECQNSTTEFSARLAQHVKKDHRVLDLFFGLGYSSAESLRRGAKSVTSFEKYPEVLELAALNPWSPPLDHLQLSLQLVDLHHPSSPFLSSFFEKNRQSFDIIIVDPPKQSVMNRIYGSSLYLSLLIDSLAPGGLISFYIPSPDSLSPRFKDLSSKIQQKNPTLKFHSESNFILTLFKN